MMKSAQEVKLTFLGDITCDRPMLKAAKQKNGEYDFDASLAPLKPLLADSDYVVGNLETVCAGEKLGYNPGPVTYNSPDSLLRAIKQNGITMVTTANNHCLDCGAQGIDRTLHLLDNCQIDHTGTVTSHAKDAMRYLVKEFNGIRIAFVSVTDKINPDMDGTEHKRSEWEQVNHLRVWKSSKSCSTYKQVLKRVLPMGAVKKLRASINRIRGIPLVTAYMDNSDIGKEDLPQIEWAIELLKEAREQSDYVIACVHCGGQFNEEPGKYSVQLYDMLEPYADAIIGNHPHVVQRVEIKQNKVRAYSLGSLNMSPSADYITKEGFPEYSAVLNLYLTQDADNQIIVSRVTGALVYTQEDENAYVTVHPVKNPDNGEARAVYRRFTRNCTTDSKENLSYECKL